jgi:hypothetical protein
MDRFAMRSGQDAAHRPALEADSLFLKLFFTGEDSSLKFKIVP